VSLWHVDGCESTWGLDATAYDLTRPQGGRMQIDRGTWAAFFLESEGWTWEQIVLDDRTNYEAALRVWERAGRTWGPWQACAP